VSERDDLTTIDKDILFAQRLEGSSRLLNSEPLPDELIKPIG
jgi:hypothetical protein